jgi:hypothetical protein
MKATWIVVGVALIWAARYILACIFWPLTDCRRCKGQGKHFAWFGGKGWRLCGRCEGTGSRFRFGARAWTKLRGKP